MSTTSDVDTPPDLMTQLRLARSSPWALALGALLGAFVPGATYVVVHMGELVRVGDGAVELAPVNHPGWALVGGGLLFSAKTVYRWGHQAFGGDWLKALGFVVLVEGVMLLSPDVRLSLVALAYLVVINALGTGATLALGERFGARGERPGKAPRPARETSQPPAAPAPSVSRPMLPAVPERSGTVSQPAPPPVPKVKATASLAVVGTADSSKGDSFTPDLYQRAEEYVQTLETITTEELRRAIVCRQPTAAALLRQLESAGVVGEPGPRGRRPVLSRGSARGSAAARASAPLA